MHMPGEYSRTGAINYVTLPKSVTHFLSFAQIIYDRENKKFYDIENIFFLYKDFMYFSNVLTK